MSAVSTDTLCVLHSAPSWLPQTQTWMHTQVRHLPADVESHVVCGSTENLDQFPVEHLHALADSPWRWRLDRVVRKAGLRRELGHLGRIAKAHDARVLHSHFGHIGWTDCHAARRLGLGHVVTFYGQDASYLPRHDPVWQQRYQEMFAGVDRVLAEGPHLASSIEALGCDPRKIVVHHLGIELDRLPFRARAWNEGEPLRVLIAGTFTEKKGIPYAIEALGALREDVDLEVSVIGDASNEPRRQREKAKILAAIDASGLAVRQLGFQPHARLLEEAYRHHVFLSPSVTAEDGDSEGGAPVTILEMAATGMPVVSTTHADIPEVLGSAGRELLSAERDSNGIASKLRALLTDVSAWPDRCEAVRAHIEREYGAERQGERLAAIYRAAIS